MICKLCDLNTSHIGLTCSQAAVKHSARLAKAKAKAKPAFTAVYEGKTLTAGSDWEMRDILERSIKEATAALEERLRRETKVTDASGEEWWLVEGGNSGYCEGYYLEKKV